MHLVIGGARGSWPVTRPSAALYGGDTTSFLVSGAAGQRVLVDAGTGLANLTDRCPPSGDAPMMLLLTHFHYDHLMGLPAFAPIYDAGRRLTVASLEHGGWTAQRVITDLFRQPFWSVPLAHEGIRMDFVDLDSAGPALEVGAVRVRWTRTAHPGGSTAFRFDEPATGASLLVATDIEWAASTEAQREAFLSLARDPDPVRHLAMDAQYEDADLPARAGWGHSTWREAVAVAEALDGPRLTLVHHDPALDDEMLAAREQQVRSAFPYATLARQGEEIQIGEG